MVSRVQVIRLAREYIGTPFQHQGRIKGYACDCVGLLLMVADELCLVDKFGLPIRKHDYTNYDPQPMDAFVHNEVTRRLISKPIEEMQDGDVVTLKVPSIPCHVAFLSTVNGVRYMIHAFTTANKVCENILDTQWQRRIEGCFAIPGVE